MLRVYGYAWHSPWARAMLYMGSKRYPTDQTITKPNGKMTACIIVWYVLYRGMRPLTFSPSV